MAPKNYNNLLASGSWSNKDPKDSHILYILGVAQKLANDSKKSSDKSNISNRESTKGDPAYIRYLPPWILEDPKVGVVNKTRDGKEYWWFK